MIRYQRDIRFIHAADLHLGSPFIGLSKTDVSLYKKMVHATEKAFESILHSAISQNVDFCLFAGDIYDAIDRNTTAQIQFIKGMGRLLEAGIEVYIVHGNHDPTPDWARSLQWPKNVHRLCSNEPEVIPIEKEGQIIAYVAGKSFPKAAVMDNFVASYPIRDNQRDASPWIGLAHCTVGTQQGHDRYAPCDLKDLLDKGYDYWALGHIHKPSIIRPENPTIVYAGNPQGRSWREQGRRGCYLVTITRDGSIHPEFIETGSIRWDRKVIECKFLEDEQALIDTVSAITNESLNSGTLMSVLLSIDLTGMSEIHTVIRKRRDLLQSIIETCSTDPVSDPFVLITSIDDRTKLPINREVLTSRGDLISLLLEQSDRIKKTPEGLSWLKEMVSPLFEQSYGRMVLESLTDEDLLEILDDAERIILDWLIEVKDAN